MVETSQDFLFDCLAFARSRLKHLGASTFIQGIYGCKSRLRILWRLNSKEAPLRLMGVINGYGQVDTLHFI